MIVLDIDAYRGVHRLRDDEVVLVAFINQTASDLIICLPLF